MMMHVMTATSERKGLAREILLRNRVFLAHTPPPLVKEHVREEVKGGICEIRDSG